MTQFPEPVRQVDTPIRLDYTYTPGVATSRFLRGIAGGRILGQRCPGCAKVYVPPRGACPMCGLPTEEQVELPGRGTVTTFCVINVPKPSLPNPYVSAQVLLDGADIPAMFLLQEVEPADVRIGMRVEAVWAEREQWGTTLENIHYFRPTGEPDAAYETYREHV